MFERTEMTRFTADVELPTFIDTDGNKWVSNPDAARGYGYANGDPRQIDKMRTKTHADELVEGTHWLTVDRGSNQPPVQGRGNNERVFWSLKGLIRLGNWVRTARGVEFRDATEALWERELTGDRTAASKELTTGEVLELLERRDARMERGFERMTQWAIAQQNSMTRLMDHVFGQQKAEKAEEYISASQWLMKTGRSVKYANRLGSMATVIGRREQWDYKRSEPFEVHPGVVKPINLRPDWEWQVTWDNTDFGDPVTRIG